MSLIVSFKKIIDKNKRDFDQLDRLRSSDVVLKTSLGLKTIFLMSWSWPKRSWSWTVLRIWKIAVSRPQFLDQKDL